MKWDRQDIGVIESGSGLCFLAETAQAIGVLDGTWAQDLGVNPLDGTNYLDTVSAFIEGFLHLLAGEGVWGRGRHLSPFPQ
jgi:hypothetical protein